MEEDRLERLLGELAIGDPPDAKAPSRLKSKIYSALMRQQAAGGPLLTLAESEAAGRGLCVFEALTNACPTGEAVKRLNLCEVCHARVLAERVERAPIFWHNCPYVGFQNR
jgi:hypothetical protein